MIGVGIYLVYRLRTHSRVASASSSQQAASAMASGGPSPIPLKGYYQPQPLGNRLPVGAPGAELVEPAELISGEPRAQALGSGQIPRQELGTEIR